MSGLPPVPASTARRSAEWAGVALQVVAAVFIFIFRNFRRHFHRSYT